MLESKVLFVLLLILKHVEGNQFQETYNVMRNELANMEKPLLYKYDEYDFETNIQSQVHLILFHNSKCPSCANVVAFLEEVARKFEGRQNEESLILATVECDTVATSLCHELKITELPTLAVFKKDIHPTAKFTGDMILSQIKQFIHNEGSLLEKHEKTRDIFLSQEVVALDDSNFEEYISNGRHFVKFHAPWCAYCQNLAPIWEELSKSLKQNNFINISKVDCIANAGTCGEHRIKSYPTLVYFKDGQQVVKYKGPMDHSSLKSFVASMKPHHSLQKLKEVTSENFDEATRDGTTIVRFYDNECPNCQNTVDGWHDLIDDVVMGGYEIQMAQINCRKNQEKCFDEYVFSVPTIIFYRDGKRVDVFRGSHSTLHDLRQFLSLLKDKQAYELPSPDLSYVAKLQMDSFDLAISSGKFVFVKFFVPWCEFCKSLSPIWEQLGIKMHQKNHTLIAEVNCSEQDKICQENQIRGYPTMLLFHNGQKIDMYTGDHEVTSLHDYVFNMIMIHDEL